MKRVKLDNLYESSLPPTDTNVLWVDIDENTGDIRAIHRYNKKTREWGPYLISYDYLTSEPDTPPEGPPEAGE